MASHVVSWRIALGVVLALIVACGPTGPTSATAGATAKGSTTPAVPDKVGFGIDGFGSAVVIYMAQNQGFFSQHGIEATIDTFGAGVDTLNAALAGREDLGFAFDFGSTGAMASNQLRYVAAIARGKGGGFQQLLARDVVKDAKRLEW